jgi:hypothetical protein
MAKLKQRGQLTDDISTSYEVFRERTRRVYDALDRLPDTVVTARVYPETHFCNTVRPGRCMASRGFKTLYHDTNHLSWLGAISVAQSVVEKIPPK